MKNFLDKQNLAYVTELEAAKDINDFNRIILENLRGLGLTHFCFSRMDSPAPCTDFQLMNQELMKVYESDGFDEIDIFQEYVASNNNPVMRSTLEEHIDSAQFVTERIARNRELFKFMHDIGFEDWFSIILRPEDGSHRATFTVGAQGASAKYVRISVVKNRSTLINFANAIHHLYCTKFSEFFCTTDDGEYTKPILNDRPLQVLRLLANGDAANLKVVASKLNISIDTVNNHISTAKESLQAKSTYHAIKRAIDLRLINPNQDN